MNGWLLRYVHNSIYLSFYLLTLMWMEVSWSFIFRKTFLELSSNTVSQHCPKQLKQMGTWFKKHFFISIQLDRRNLRRSQSDLKRCWVHPFMSLPSLSLLGCELKASCCLRWVLGLGCVSTSFIEVNLGSHALDHAGPAVRRDFGFHFFFDIFPIHFSCIVECCKAVLLWGSKNVLCTIKLPEFPSPFP